MILVGLTGNIGSGKTTVSRLFAMLDVPVYYADEKGRQFLGLAEIQEKVISLFGEKVLSDNGKIDRHKLASVVFADKEKLRQLNAVIHPLVRADFRQWADKQAGHPYVMEEAAILFESGLAGDFDKIVLVAAPEDLRISRVCKRDGVEADSVRQRARHQWPESDKRPISDFVIENDENSLLIDQVQKVHGQLLKAAGVSGQ